MLKAFVRSAILFVVAWASCSPAYAQATQQTNSSVVAPVDGWTGQRIPQNHPAGPAPRHDIFGIWDPGNGGIQAMGAAAMPEDGKTEHKLPYTPAGLEALSLTKPSNGSRSVSPWRHERSGRGM